MIELYQLKQLITIAEAGTISKAAELLLISQPALTRSIQRLEGDLDLKLFDRKKNKITLNDNGQLAVEYAKTIISEADKMVTQLRNYDRKKHVISIGSCAPAPVWGLQYIFNKTYPELNVTHAIDSHEEKLLNGLENNQYSIIILNHPLKNSNYICKELFDEHLYLSVPPDHPLAFLKELTFNDLNGESVLLLSGIGFWNKICIKMIPKSHLLIQDDVAVFNELIRGSALPNFKSNITMMREKDDINRIAIPIIDKEAKATYFAIYHKEDHKRFSPITKELSNIDWTKTVY